MSESFAELFEQSFASQTIKQGAIIKGIIVKISNEVVVVSAGLKSEAVIPINQFQSEKDSISVGDEIEVALDAFEDGFGETRLSREKAIRARSWVNLQESHDKSDVVNGFISGRVKGGFTVEIEGIRAFLPGSLVDVRPVRDPSYLEGKTVELKVIKVDKQRNNVVVSRKAVVENEYSEERNQLLATIEEGIKTKGIIKNLTDYGAFVDLGGIDGLLHITDMAWKRVKHPSEMLNVGDEIEVIVLKYEKDKQRVSLGMKQLGKDPWHEIKLRYPVDTKIHGTISNIADYGCFVEIEEGVEGLVHVSEMDWTNRNVNPAKIVAVDQEIEVMVLEIDGERRRISLGIKQCQINPWAEFSEKVKKGDKVKGQIKSITDFGVFIGLEGGIDGLVHLSDISWETSEEESARNFKKGQEVEAIVLGIDTDRERISLGIKQLNEDPFAFWIKNHPKNSLIKGSVVEVDEKNAYIDVGPNIKASIHVSELSLERIDDARTAVQVNQEIEAKIINIDRKTKLISLSIKAKEEHDEKEALDTYQSDSSSKNNGATTLGELLKEKMVKE
ncbi:MAG TPA: 30S ribosomal protein S1 [Woeseiaceae bacterium]|nr:30S ribosomal protein S1 [Woeseiaceae bacterium]